MMEGKEKTPAEVAKELGIDPESAEELRLNGETLDELTGGKGDDDE